MHNFNPADFVALSPAKAKAQALAMFTDAHASPSPDWYGVALALHSVISRKRGKVQDDIAMQDAADASEFIAWADYQPTGKGTAIARGRVTVTFADGWTATLGMLAGKTGKGRKPWSIGLAMRQAVILYKLAAVRRATGCDALLYHERTGQEAGLSVALDALIDVPEFVSIESADSAETVEGDLIWSACEANGFTRDQRAGAVAVPLALAPMPRDIAVALQSARVELVARMGLVRSFMLDGAKAAAARVEALLYPAPSLDVHGYAADCEPEAVEPVALEEETTDAPADDEPGLFADAPADEPAGEEIADAPFDSVWTPEVIAAEVDKALNDPRADLESVDHSTMLAATDIVGPAALGNGAALDDWAVTLSAVSYRERFLLVEDALLAWPALVEPCAAIDGEPVAVVPTAEIEAPADRHEIAAKAAGWIMGQHGKWINPALNDGASYLDNRRAFRNICEDYRLASPLEPVEPVAAVTAPAEPVKPASKPRYSVGADGKWSLIS